MINVECMRSSLSCYVERMHIDLNTCVNPLLFQALESSPVVVLVHESPPTMKRQVNSMELYHVSENMLW